jgi:hypothetical protein
MRITALRKEKGGKNDDEEYPCVIHKYWEGLNYISENFFTKLTRKYDHGTNDTLIMDRK